MILYMLIIGFITVILPKSNAYVLLQVSRKDANHSNIDALIHKVVPSDQIPMLQNTRKQNDEGPEKGFKNAIINMNKNNVYLLKEDTVQHENLDVLLKSLVRNLWQFSNKSDTKEKNTEDEFIVIKPKPNTIDMRSKTEAPVVNLGTSDIVNALDSVLSSNTFKQYMDGFSQKAAQVVFRALATNILTKNNNKRRSDDSG